MKRVIVVLLLVIGSFYESNGQITFQKKYVYQAIFGYHDTFGSSVQETSDSSYVILLEGWLFGVGYFEMVLLKTDKEGNLLWSKTLGPGNAYSLQQTNDSGFIVCGYSFNDSLAGFGIDIRLIKTDDSGNILWSKAIGGIYSEYGYAVEQTSDNGYIITGFTDGYGAIYRDIYVVKTDSTGSLQWSKTFPSGTGYGYSVHQTMDGGYIIAGKQSAFGAGHDDAILIKLDSAGNSSWKRTFGNAWNDQANSVQQTPDSGYIVTGFISDYLVGPKHIYVVKFDKGGYLIWSKEYIRDILEDEVGTNILQSLDGGFLISGDIGPTSDHTCLFKIDSIGNIIWTKVYGGSVVNSPSDAELTKDKGLIICGGINNLTLNQAYLYLIKTDSLGNSGCNDTSFTLFSTIPPTQIFTPLTIDSSGGASYDYFLPNQNAIVHEYTICNPLGIEEIKSFELSISPNPASSTISISFPTAASQTIKTKITSVTGEIVFRQENKATAPVTKYELPVSKLSNGIYFLSVQTEGELVTRKIVVQH